jgi:hypothetical protein
MSDREQGMDARVREWMESLRPMAGDHPRVTVVPLPPGAHVEDGKLVLTASVSVRTMEAK